MLRDTRMIDLNDIEAAPQRGVDPLTDLMLSSLCSASVRMNRQALDRSLLYIAFDFRLDSCQ